MGIFVWIVIGLVAGWLAHAFWAVVAAFSVN